MASEQHTIDELQKQIESLATEFEEQSHVFKSLNGTFVFVVCSVRRP